MEPNGYQRKLLLRLRGFLRLLENMPSPAEAYAALWAEQDITINPVGGDGMPPYRDTITGVPHVCFKVPTGGGKTFLAACALRLIKDAIVQSGEGVVVWLVPSDTILEQTLKNLRNVDHDYRQQLQKDFPAGVEIYSKEQLLAGQSFLNPTSVQEHLSVLVLSYDSFKDTKDGRRAFRENERLKDFPVSTTLPEGADETSLINAINILNPIVIVDESHHATSQLSVGMLRNFNPRFILDLTATPRENSNIIAFAEASELKKANMVKLPLIVYNRAHKNDVMFEAIQLRAQIENQAIAEEEHQANAEQAMGDQEKRPYIRPIVLFQAQPRGKEDATTFRKLKADLVAGGIPEEQIAIKTADVNELKNVDLLSRDCEIRYIITINALKEGWDCPFAYILATLANKSSKVDVEQIVGRILRQPYAMTHSQPLLNNAFVLTCSNDFADTLDGIVRSLNSAGFSKKDVRVADEKPQSTPVTPPTVQPSFIDDEPEDDYEDEFLGNYSEVISAALQQPLAPSVGEMLSQAAAQTQEYQREAKESESLGYLGGLEGAMRNQYKVNEAFRDEAESLRLPQFCFPVEPDLIHRDKYQKLAKENLINGFSLQNADSNVNFALAGGDIYLVDASNIGVKYRKMTEGESIYFRSQMERLPDDDKRKHCVEIIVHQLERHPIGDVLLKDDLTNYVGRVIANLSNDDLALLQTSYQFYARRIQEKIESLLSKHREKQFLEKLDSRDILCRPLFKLPTIITPTETIVGLEKSLYESEAWVSPTERRVIEEIASRSNVRWWHRVSESKPYSFCINGFINHFPDFLVMTEKGTLVVVEVKGDDRDNSDSERKLRLGRKWAEKAGDGYRYYMVFDKLNWSKEGAYDLVDFVGLLERL